MSKSLTLEDLKKKWSKLALPSGLKQDEVIELLANAYEARRQAYAPYSSFAVGSAVLTKADNIFTGCNIENASYGATTA